MYTRAELEKKTLFELKAIALELGTEPSGDRRVKETWVKAIIVGVATPWEPSRPKAIATDYSAQEPKERSAKSKPSAQTIAEEIAKEYHDRLTYNGKTRQWYRYEADEPKVWSPDTKEYFEAVIYKILKSKNITDFNYNYLTSVIKFLRYKLINHNWTCGDLNSNGPEVHPQPLKIGSTVAHKLYPTKPLGEIYQFFRGDRVGVDGPNGRNSYLIKNLVAARSPPG